MTTTLGQTPSQSSNSSPTQTQASDIGTPLRGSIVSSSHDPSKALSRGRFQRVLRILKQPIRAIVQCRTWFIKRFTISAMALSDHLFDHPFRAAIIFTILCCALSSGFFVATVEQNIYNLYAMPQTRALQNGTIINKAFTPKRANFVMFRNPPTAEAPNEPNQDIFSSPHLMSGLWALDDYLKNRMAVPRLIFQDGLARGIHIWSFLDDTSDLDRGYLRFADVCELLPNIHQWPDAEGSTYKERIQSNVFSNTKAELETSLKEWDKTTHCDYTSALAAWNSPRTFARNHASPSEKRVEAPTKPFKPNSAPGVQVRKWPWMASVTKGAGGQTRTVNVLINYFNVKTGQVDDTKVPGAKVKTLTGASGLMNVYYTQKCEEGKFCEAILWENQLVQLITTLYDTRRRLLAAGRPADLPETALPLAWIDDFGKVVRAQWEDVVEHCWNWSELALTGNRDPLHRVSGSIMCYDLPNDEPMPEHTLVLNLLDLDLSVYAESSWADELARGTAFNRELMLNYLCSFFILMFFGIAATSTRSVYRSKSIVGLCGAVSGLLGYLGGAGLCYLCGLKHTATMNAVPFLAMGIAMDDAFVMINAYALTYYLEAYDPNEPVDQDRDYKLNIAKKRCRLALAESALAITLTTATNVVSFSVGALTPYMAARNFCTICVLGLVGGYIGALAFFWPAVCLMARFEVLRPPPPLLMERIISKMHLDMTNPRPTFLPEALGAVALEDATPNDLIRINTLVTKRQFRVIHFTNELTRRHLKDKIAASKDLARRLWNSTRVKSAPPSPPSRRNPRNIEEEPEELSQATRSPQSFGSDRPFLPSPDGMAEGEGEGEIVDEQLISYLNHAKEDYKEIQPPKGTLHRKVRSFLVSSTGTLMRRPLFRWITLGLFAGFISSMVVVIYRRFEFGLEQLDLVPPDSYLHNSYEMMDKNKIYPVEGNMIFFLNGSPITECGPIIQDFIADLKADETLSSVIDPIDVFESGIKDPTPITSPEWQNALYDYQKNKPQGALMNGFFGWSGHVENENSVANPKLETIKIVYFNKFFEDVSIQSDHFVAMRSKIDAFNAEPSNLGVRVVEYNSLHPFFENDALILNQTLSSMCGALIGIGIVTSLLMESDYLIHPYSLLVVAMTGLIDLTVFGAMAVLGIKLNIITMILLIMSIGFSVDYCLHTAHQYNHMKGNVLERMAMTMVYIGLPLFQGLMSTLLSLLPLLTRLDEYIFSTFLYMVFIVLIVGFIYGVGLLPQILVFLDRLMGYSSECPGIKVMAAEYRNELADRQKRDLESARLN